MKTGCKSVCYNVSCYLESPQINISTLDRALHAVVMSHEWWALNDNIKDISDQLTSEGYVLLEADPLNGTVTANPE